MNTFVQPLTSTSNVIIPINQNFSCTFSLKNAGNMRCQNSIKSLLHSRGIEFNKLRRVNQTHSKVVASAAECLIPHPTLGLTSNFSADGVIADSYQANKNVTLMVTIADCLPIFITADNGAYGIVHSGWKGTGIIEKAINSMVKYFNCNLNSFKVIIGPGISECCYKVDRIRYDYFLKTYKNDSVRLSSTGDHYLNLQAANTFILRKLGVKNIDIINECTYCSSRLFSYRQESPNHFFPLMAAFISPI